MKIRTRMEQDEWVEFQDGHQTGVFATRHSSLHWFDSPGYLTVTPLFFKVVIRNGVGSVCLRYVIKRHLRQVSVSAR